LSRPPALKTSLLLICFAALPVFAGSGADPHVLEYVRQTRVQRGKARYVVDVTFSASLPALSKKGVLRAIKRQAPQGQLYESMNFEGDGLVKTNIIARYLQAEFENQRPEEKLATEISPLNYQFNLKGEERIGDREALVYEVKPLRHRPGLFKGKVWLDKETLLPLREQGKLEKVPSVWIKEIVFTREYHLEHGLSLPSAIHSEVNTRIVGKSVINIEFSHYQLMDPPGLLQAVAEASSQQD
jgi:hypothetical protein